MSSWFIIGLLWLYFMSSYFSPSLEEVFVCRGYMSREIMKEFTQDWSKSSLQWKIFVGVASGARLLYLIRLSSRSSCGALWWCGGSGALGTNLSPAFRTSLWCRTQLRSCPTCPWFVNGSGNTRSSKPHDLLVRASQSPPRCRGPKSICSDHKYSTHFSYLPAAFAIFLSRQRTCR